MLAPFYSGRMSSATAQEPNDRIDAPGLPTPRRSSCLLHGCLGLFLLAVVVAAVLSGIISQHDPTLALIQSCANNLKQIGLSMKMYANEDPREHFPPLSPVPGRLAPSRLAVYPEYIVDPWINICPSDSDFSRLDELKRHGDWRSPKVVDQFFDDISYFYLGYLVSNDEDMELFARAYRDAVAARKPMDGDYTSVPSAKYGLRGKLFRLREGIERVFIGDEPEGGDLERARAIVPILIERVGNHKPSGANVLYLDGHVEYIKYPGKWPMTPKTVRLLQELDDLGHPAH
jgi:prepilin-type processing-associated H-X9-DG protein